MSDIIGTDRDSFQSLVESLGEALSLLSVREREVIDLAANGRTDEQISQMLGLSPSTVNSYWVRIRGKLGFYSRTEVVALMLRHEMREQQIQLRADNARLRMEMKEAVGELQELRTMHTAHLEGAWQFNALIHLPEAVLVTEPPARVVFANRKALSFYRASLDELRGLPMRALTTAETPEAIREPCRRMFEPGGPESEVHGIERPYYALRRDGSNFRAVIKADRFESPAGPFVAVALHEYMADLGAMMSSLSKPLATGRI